jgi:hypothetical protein
MQGGKEIQRDQDKPKPKRRAQEKEKKKHGAAVCNAGGYRASTEKDDEKKEQDENSELTKTRRRDARQEN